MMFLFVFGQFCTITFLSASLVFNAGLDEKHLFLVYLLGGLCTIVTSPMTGRLVDRFGAYRVALIAVCISTVPTFIVTHLGPTNEWLVLILTSLFFIVSNGRMVPAQALAAATVPPQRRGSFMSLNSSGMQMAAGFAALVAGAVTLRHEGGRLLHFNYVGYISIGVSLIGVWLLVVRERAVRKMTTPHDY
jgi:predicted MFS family arabinose efflux permease